MFVVRTGRGWILPLAFFPVAVATEALLEAVTSDDQIYQDHLWSISIVFLVPTLLSLLVQSSERPEPVPAGALPSQRKAARRTRSSFMAIPVRWWTLIFIGAAIVLAVADVVRARDDSTSSIATSVGRTEPADDRAASWWYEGVSPDR